MNHILSKQSYKDLLDKLRKTEEWLNGLNVPFSGSRFGKYEKNIKMLNEYFQEGKIDEFQKMKDFGDIVVSLSESTEIVEIYGQLKDLNPDFLRRKLKLIVKGPFSTTSEKTDRGTNIGRNTFYELYTMAVLRRGGFQILLKHPSDVACAFESKILLFECKRPQTKGAVKRNFYSAVKQLTKSLNNLAETNSRGIVAISVGKILNRGDKLLIGRNESDLAKKIDRILEGIVRDFQYLHTKVIDTRSTVIQDIDLLTNVQEIAINNICLANSSDYSLLKRMESRLNFERA